VRRGDIEALGALAGDALAGGGTLIRGMHEGIASRPFEILGPAAAPVRVIHDGVSRAVYNGMRTGLRAAARGGARAAAHRAADGDPALGSAVRSSLALGALNGVYGGHLRGRLELEMQVRRRGAEVPLTLEGVARAFPDATSRIVVFAHGLCETDVAWRAMTRRPDGSRRRSYGERLQDELSFTPVYVRYNSGLRVSENGRTLAHRLAELVAAWPVRVEEIVLVGHSMGGLVARSACHHAEQEDLVWADAVRHVFCLGSPHVDAGLEKGAAALSRALTRLPETRALAELLNARSAGIKDLPLGSRAETDWIERDPDEFLRDCHQELPFLPDANYHFLGGRNRFELLNHPAVYEQLRAWITRPPRRAPRSPAAPV
jgi:pimeloyl-ACP methyl ester carboxylesterase